MSATELPDSGPVADVEAERRLRNLLAEATKIIIKNGYKRSDELRQILLEVARDEREACAKLVENARGYGGVTLAYVDLAALIRARGEA